MSSRLIFLSSVKRDEYLGSMFFLTEISPSLYITASADSDVINQKIFTQNSGQGSFDWPIVTRPRCELIAIRARPSPTLN